MALLNPILSKPELNIYKKNILNWLPIVVGLIVLYAPTFQFLSENLWNTDEQAHGPIILLVSVYLMWQKREFFCSDSHDLKPIRGGILLSLGLLMYAIGRSQEILFFEIGSLIPVLIGTSLLTLGSKFFYQVRFAILFTVFMIPLPGVVVDLLTNPLKQYISVLAENILYHLDYPIARSGVTISIGSYKLLVANACSGLHSMFSLSALGFLYLNLMQYKNGARNLLIIASFLPIAFLANLIRVIILILITYYWGDEVGQGFVHKFAGMFLFAISLIFIFLFDFIVGYFAMFKDKKETDKPI